MAARYPSYILKDSSEGARKEAEISGKPPRNGPFGHSPRQGFIYPGVPLIELRAIAHNSEIDIIWEKWQMELGPILDRLNEVLDQAWEEWEVAREAEDEWPAEAKMVHGLWWEARHARKQEIDLAIARNAEIEYLVDRPY